jgi:hypothetical protein
MYDGEIIRRKRNTTVEGRLHNSLTTTQMKSFRLQVGLYGTTRRKVSRKVQLKHKNEKYVTVCIIILALAVESTKVEEHTKNSPLPSSKRSNNQLLPLSSSRNQQYWSVVELVWYYGTCWYPGTRYQVPPNDNNKYLEEVSVMICISCLILSSILYCVVTRVVYICTCTFVYRISLSYIR